MEQVDVDLARWAVGPGMPAIARATAALGEGQDPLVVVTGLRRLVAPAQASFAVTAAAARLRAIDEGVPGAAQLVLTTEAAAQASAPAVAAWRARAVVEHWRAVGAADPVVDLCAGTGADATAVAAAGAPVVAVERDPGRAVLLAHRAAVLDVPVEVVIGDALAPPVALTGRVVHADPDRRDGSGRRARSLVAHGPPVGDLLRTCADAGAAVTMITVAPGVAWDDPDLPGDAGVTFVEVGGTLIEAVVQSPSDHRARAVLLPDGLVATRPHDDELEQVPVGAVGTHLLLPAVALVRARLHDDLARRVGARRVARRRALLSVDGPVDDPWLRSERVAATLQPRPAALRRWLRGDDAGGSAADQAGARELAATSGVELVLHGIDVDPRRFLRDAGVRTGPHGVRLHLVRRDDDSIGVLTVPSR